MMEPARGFVPEPVGRYFSGRIPVGSVAFADCGYANALEEAASAIVPPTRALRPVSASACIGWAGPEL